MRGRNTLLSGLILCASTSFAVACLIDFPNQLLNNRDDTLKSPPANLFDYTIVHLVNTPHDSLMPVENQNYYSQLTKHYYFGPEAKKQALADGIAPGLSSEQAVLLAKLVAAQDSNAILAATDNFPADVRLYSAGAVDYGRGQTDLAAQRWQAVLDLSEEQRYLRSTYAAYMLGELAVASGDADKAAKEFALTRDLARAGLQDDDGLAVASYGEEARLHLRRARKLAENGSVPDAAIAEYAKEMDAAITLYAEQAIRSSEGGKESLRFVAQTIISNRSFLAAAAQAPNAQRLAVGFILARFYSEVPDPNVPVTEGADEKPSDGSQFTTKDVIKTLAEESERHGEDWLADAQWLAALAYREEEFDLTKRLLEKTRGPLASWLNAKLAVRSGDIAKATSSYAEAIKAFPTVDGDNPLDESNRSLLLGESGVLALARSEYVIALEQLNASGPDYWLDTAYVAERVLTVDELKTFVDAKVPPTKADSPKHWGAGDIRDLLARRLMREGRYQEALPYFKKPETRQQAADYASFLDAGSHKWSSIARAEALYRAAVLARKSGMEMMGSEGGPDYFTWGGAYEFRRGRSDKDQNAPFVTEGEKQRFAATEPKPYQRFHYRYIASDLAKQSSDLLPPRSQAFAAVLCKATGWMFQTHENDKANEFYHAYVKQGAVVPWATHFGYSCPNPDFDAAPKTQRKQIIGQMRQFVSQQRWAFAAAGLSFAAAALIGGLLWRRRRRLSV